jgi:hypothetical protein
MLVAIPTPVLKVGLSSLFFARPTEMPAADHPHFVLGAKATATAIGKINAVIRFAKITGDADFGRERPREVGRLSDRARWRCRPAGDDDRSKRED